MKLKRFIFSIFSGILLSNSTFCQSPEIPLPENPTTKDRLVVGGSLGLMAGTYTNIDLLPLLGYRLTDRFAVLTGPMYSYYHEPGYSDNSYGARALARFFPFNSFYLQAESDWFSYGVKGLPTRKEYTYMMVGAGINSYGSTLELLYILNNPANTKYLNPFILRVGFVIPLSRL